MCFFSKGPFCIPAPCHSSGRDRSALRINRGRARRVPEPVSERKEKILVHRSVKTRMEAEGMEEGKYTSRAKFEHLNFEWVD